MTSFLSVVPAGAPAHQFSLSAEPRLCTGPAGERYLFGGCGLGSAIQALEAVADRPLVWASAQFLSFAPIGSRLDLEVTELARGRSVTQARAVARVAGREIYSVSAALGRREEPVGGEWARAPAVPPPDACIPMPPFRGREGTIHDHFDVRIAKGRYGPMRDGTPDPDGHTWIWLRLREDDRPPDASRLAIFADLIPGGVGSALGRDAGGTSLDISIRLRTVVPTGWVLGDIAIDSIHAGFAHGRMRLFAESGELMALASQTLILRVRD